MADLRRNDEALAFFAANGYPTEYNDGMLAWLRAFYSTTRFTLNDLLHRYLDDFNTYDMLPAGSNGFLLMEDSSFLLQENNDKIILESA